MVSGSTTAGDVYALALERHDRHHLRRVRLGAWVVFSVLSCGFFGTLSIGDLVVRRIEDGKEVLRTDADSEDSAALLFEHVRRQLATLEPDEFRDAWQAWDE